MPPRSQKRPTRAATRRRIFIREWREFRGLTQEALGEMTNRTKATISRIENGDISYTRDFLEDAADALGTHPGMLLMRAPTQDDAAGADRRAKS